MRHAVEEGGDAAADRALQLLRPLHAIDPAAYAEIEDAGVQIPHVLELGFGQRCRGRQRQAAIVADLADYRGEDALAQQLLIARVEADTLEPREHVDTHPLISDGAARV